MESHRIARMEKAFNRVKRKRATESEGKKESEMQRENEGLVETHGRVLERTAPLDEVDREGQREVAERKV